MKLTTILLLSNIWIQSLFAQENFISCGGNFSSNSGSVSYSIGQIAYSTENNSSYSITEGLQQPYEISQLLSLPEASSISINLTVFPNPTSESIKIEIDKNELDHYNYQISDSKGEILIKNKLIKTEEFIDLSKFSQSTYFLKIISNLTQKEIKIVKISKI